MKKSKGLPAGRQGFTLIELLLVIAILGIITVMGFASYTTSLQRGRDSKRKNDIRQVGNALELYFADKERYPVGTVDGAITGANWGSAFTDGTTIYMAQLPKDPISTQQFYYVSDGTYYQIYTRLENTKDGDIPHNGTTPETYSNTNCGTIECNYGVSSTNVTVTQDHAIHE
jgi:general secretion pathway protein G